MADGMRSEANYVKLSQQSLCRSQYCPMHLSPGHDDGDGWLCSRVYHPVTDGRVCGPIRNQPPVHKPALVNTLLTDNGGNVGGTLRGDVKAACVMRQIAV